ncbi:MAG: hypothetical protein L6Q59_17345, partial [Ignavibacteriaceae bacterium]|nr:hypothetical protein [Ignavibacteriaceae bacterium]
QPFILFFQAQVIEPICFPLQELTRVFGPAGRRDLALRVVERGDQIKANHLQYYQREQAAMPNKKLDNGMHVR